MAPRKKKLMAPPEPLTPLNAEAHELLEAEVKPQSFIDRFLHGPAEAEVVEEPKPKKVDSPSSLTKVAAKQRKFHSLKGS